MTQSAGPVHWWDLASGKKRGLPDDGVRCPKYLVLSIRASSREIVGSWELEQAHVPALLPLLRVGERAQEGGRVRDRERDGATDVRRRGGAHGVGDRADPVVADEVDLAAVAIDQGDGVGGEVTKQSRSRSRKGRDYECVE